MTSFPAHKSTFKAVLFDLDGTLFDSLADLGEAMNAVLSSRGYPTHPIAAYRYFVGDGMLKLVTRALPADIGKEPDVVDGCVAEMKSEYGRRWHHKSKLYPGIAALLDGLRDRKMPLAILSNKPDDLTRAIQSRFLAAWQFSKVRGATPQFPLKPDPAGARAIAAELAIAPESIIYLGDTAVDMSTANAAGMFAIGCLWGFREALELREAGARSLINSPLELLEFLDRA